MKKIYKKSLRDLLKNKLQYISVFIVILLGTALFLGFSTTSSFMDNYLKTYCKDYNMPDLWVYYSGITKDQADEIFDIDDVDQIEARYTYDVSVNYDDGHQSKLTLTSYDEDSNITEPYVCKGRLPENDHEMTVDREYADANDISIGDELTVSLEGCDIDMEVVGTVESVEHMLKLANSLSDIPDHEAYGIGYFYTDTIKAEFGAQPDYNQVIVTADKDTDVYKLSDEIKDKTEDYNYINAANRQMNTGYASFSANVDQNKRFGFICPVIFFLIAAMILFITISNLINTQRTQIGVMKALGYKKSMIVKHYMFNSIAVSILGTVVGGVIGNIVMPRILVAALLRQLDVPEVTFGFHYLNIIPAALLMSAIAAVATLLSCRKPLKEGPASAMRPKSPKADHKILMERIPGLWSSMKTDSKMAMRNIFSNKKRTILSILGITGSMMLIVVGFGLKDSCNELLKIQYKDILISDVEVNFNYAVRNDSGMYDYTDVKDIELPEGTKALAYTSIPSEVHVGSGDAEEIIYASLVSFDGDYEDYISILDKNDKNIDIKDDGVVISQSIANKYGYKTGDKIKLRTIDSNYESTDIEAEINDISYQYLTQEIYCTEAFMESYDIDPNPLNMYVNVEKGTSAKDVAAEFGDMKEVSAARMIDDIEADAVEFTSVIVMDTIVLSIVAFLISLAVISSISNINYIERKRVLATMKSTGYSNGRIFKVFVKENMFVSVIGGLLGIPAGIGLLFSVLDLVQTTTCAYPKPPVLLNVTISFCMILVYSLIANLTVRRKIKKLNTIETLKAVE